MIIRDATSSHPLITTRTHASQPTASRVEGLSRLDGDPLARQNNCQIKMVVIFGGRRDW